MLCNDEILDYLWMCFYKLGKMNLGCVVILRHNLVGDTSTKAVSAVNYVNKRPSC